MAARSEHFPSVGKCPWALGAGSVAVLTVIDAAWAGWGASRTTTRTVANRVAAARLRSFLCARMCLLDRCPPRTPFGKPLPHPPLGWGEQQVLFSQIG